MDFGSIQTVAGQPFSQSDRQRQGRETVRDVFMTMLQAIGARCTSCPRASRAWHQPLSLREPTAPSAEDPSSCAQLVGAEVVITGVVSEYGELRSGGPRPT
jgi:hypothetical protein